MTTTLDTTTRETISEAEYRTYPDFETLQIALTRDGHWDMDSGWSAARLTIFSPTLADLERLRAAVDDAIMRHGTGEIDA